MQRFRIADRVQDSRTTPPRVGTIWELRGTRVSVWWDGTEGEPGRNHSHVKAKHLTLIPSTDHNARSVLA